MGVVLRVWDRLSRGVGVGDILSHSPDDWVGVGQPSEIYKYLYTTTRKPDSVLVVIDGSPPDVVFEGNSREVIRSFPKDVRSNLGADLDRVQNGEKPLDSAPMAPVLAGCSSCGTRTGTSGIGYCTSRSRAWFMFSTASKRRPTRLPRMTSRLRENGFPL